jgi:hypothetical protein
VALIVRCVEPGVCRVSSRQSGLGRVVIDADDSRERHLVALGSGPVHLFEGNYSVKVELPPIVLRMTVAIAAVARRDAAAPSRVVSPLAAAERTAVTWTPERPGSDSPPWITVAALASPCTGTRSWRGRRAPVRPCDGSAACGAATPASTG